MHRSTLERIVKRVRGGTSEVTGLQIIIFCVGVTLAFLFILILSIVDFPDLF